MTKEVFVSCYVLVTWFLIHKTLGQDKQFLYYTSPSGDKQNLPGLYGGYINPANSGRAFDLQQVAIKCAAMPPNGFYGGLNLKGASYDPYSNEVLLEIDEHTDTQNSLIKGSLCQKNSVCDQSDVYVFFSTGSNADRVQDAKLGPFARWKSDIYFVSRRYKQGEHSKQRIMRMAIHKLIGCQSEYPFTANNPIDLEACSEEVAFILEEKADDVVLVMRETQIPTSTLHVVDSGTDLHFLVQVHNQQFNEEDILLNYSMDLYAAKLHETTQPATRLHSQPLPLTWTWHRLRDIGAIDYKHGVLCWSATDRILCSKWKPGHQALAQIHQVLQPGMATQVCNGTGEFLPEVVTGLAIAKESDPLSLYFGCMSQLENMGGAGLLTLNADWSKGNLYPLLDRHRKILAGNMFLTTVCENMALKEDEIQSDEAAEKEKQRQPQLIERSDDKLESQEPVQPVGAVKGSATKSYTLVQLILTLLLCIIFEHL